MGDNTEMGTLAVTEEQPLAGRRSRPLPLAATIKTHPGGHHLERAAGSRSSRRAPSPRRRGATWRIRRLRRSFSSASLSCRSAASRTGVPSSSVTRSPGLSPARSAADCGSTWRTTAPGGRTLFGRWFPGALRIRSRVLRRLPGRGFLARRFLLFGVQFLAHRQRPHLGIVPPCPRPRRASQWRPRPSPAASAIRRAGRPWPSDRRRGRSARSRR